MYAEFLALRSIEHQMLNTIEQHLEDIPLANIKLLVKVQKTLNNTILRMMAKISGDMPQVIKKIKLAHPNTDATTPALPPANMAATVDDEPASSQAMME